MGIINASADTIIKVQQKHLRLNLIWLKFIAFFQSVTRTATTCHLSLSLFLSVSFHFESSNVILFVYLVVRPAGIALFSRWFIDSFIQSTRDSKVYFNLISLFAVIGRHYELALERAPKWIWIQFRPLSSRLTVTCADSCCCGLNRCCFFFRQIG